MSRKITELAWAQTPMGEISLRRRVEPVTGQVVHEVRLGEEYLMSSMFTASEVALARLGLAAVRPDRPGGQAGLQVVVGGLGLGFTAVTALEDDRVTDLTVVEALPEVIGWHTEGLVPGGADLAGDPRTTLLPGDFFALAAGDGFDPAQPGRRWDAVLLDVDHTPHHVLHPSHAAFYSADGLAALARFLRPGGVFALWSDDPPDDEMEALLGLVFAESSAHVVSFDNVLTGGRSACTVYVAVVASGARPGDGAPASERR